MTSFTRISLLAATVAAFALTGTVASAYDALQVAVKPSADTPAADLRSALDQLLGEHVQLAADATNAALNGRDAEFKAAAAALDANSVDISEAIGSIYGKDAGEAFLGLWRSHIGMVVDYTVGTASKDKAKQDKAVGELMQYTQDFGAFLHSANNYLPQDGVAELVKHHAVTLKAVIDAQAAGDQAKAYMALRAAYSHMAMIAEALAQGIVKQFPKKFG
jgi:hypothetical protein